MVRLQPSEYTFVRRRIESQPKISLLILKIGILLTLSGAPVYVLGFGEITVLYSKEYFCAVFGPIPYKNE